MEVIQDIKVIEVSGFERRMFWYLILLMDPYCAGRGDEASKLKINIASCCLKGPKRRSINGYCWGRCHHRPSLPSWLSSMPPLMWGLSFHLPDFFQVGKGYCLWLVIRNTKRKELLIQLLTHSSRISLSFCSRCTMLFPQALDMYWHEDCLKCGCCDCRLGEVTNWPQLFLPQHHCMYSLF